MFTLAFISNLLGPQGGIILLAVLLLFGAKRLPEIGRSLGETVREFSKPKEDEKTAAEKLNERK